MGALWTLSAQRRVRARRRTPAGSREPIGVFSPAKYDGHSMLYERLLNKRPTIYLQPSEFMKAVVDYFKWCEEHPLLEEQVFQYKGCIVRADKGKMRPFTKQGLATYLGIPVSRLDGYKKRGGEWAETVEIIEQVMYDQKFSGAAAGLLNAGIITRDLGLTDKQETTLAGAAGGEPITFNIMPVAAGTFLPPEQPDQDDEAPSQSS